MPDVTRLIPQDMLGRELGKRDLFVSVRPGKDRLEVFRLLAVLDGYVRVERVVPESPVLTTFGIGYLMCTALRLPDGFLDDD